MKSRFFWIFVWLFLPVAASASDVWTRIPGKNFVLIGNASEKEIRRTGVRLEQFRFLLQEFLPNQELDRDPTTVFVFKSHADFKLFQPLGASDNNYVRDFATGYLRIGKTANYIVLTIEDNSQTAFQPIFHDYVHLIINKRFGRALVPPWVSEGLAEYLQTLSFENEQSLRLGAAAEKNLRLLKEQNLLSLERLFAFDYYTLGSQGDHGKNIFYAESWALTNYLQQGDQTKRREQTKMFLSLLVSNKPVNQAFAAAFQIDLATFEKEFKNYLARNLFASKIFLLKDKVFFSDSVQSVRLTDSEIAAQKGDLLRDLNRFDESANLLRQAIKLDAKNASAYASLGATLAAQNKFAEAFECFEQAITLDPKNHLTFFYYADALRAETIDDDNFVRPFSNAKTVRIGELLARAIALNAEFSPSYRLLAFVNFANNTGLNEAIVLLNKAIALEPGNEKYQLDLGRIYYRQEKFDQARNLARQISAHAADATIRANAQILLSNVNSLEEQLRQIRERNARQASENQSPAIQYSEEELINQSLNEALRKPKAGEKRIIGFLSNVICDGAGINFIVNTKNQIENKIFKLRANDFLSVRLMSFTTQASGKPIDCGARQPNDFVVANYRPSVQSKTNVDGEIVSLEFVPETLILNP